MKRKFILSLTIVLASCFFAQAQNKTSAALQQAAQKTEYTAQDYENMLAKLKGGDANIDYKALRMAFTKTKNYYYDGANRDEQNKFYKPFGEKNYEEALKQAEKFLGKNYVDVDTHYVAYRAATELKDVAKAEFHKSVLLGLLNSIKNGNDGSSEKNPFFVISLGEEYALMRFTGYHHISQRLQHRDGHTFDVFEAVNTKSNEKATLYFNIDIVWAAEKLSFRQIKF